MRRGGGKDVNADERIAVGHEIMAAPVDVLCRLVYPSLYPLHDPSGNWGTEDPASGAVPLPPTMALSLTQLSDMGAYLMDNGRVFILWLGRMVHKDWATEVRAWGIIVRFNQSGKQVILHKLAARQCQLFAAGRKLLVHASLFLYRTLDHGTVAP